MPRWQPLRVWADQDCFIIGGGASLAKFDWQRLIPENTIGCNTAFTLGNAVCKVCIFGDYRWWQVHGAELAGYKGIVFTNAPALLYTKIPWLWTMARETRGLHTNSLGWNGNTGASAINLAILFGAKRIFLLGFDMKHVDSRSNWHNRIINPKAVLPSVYPKFIEQYKVVCKDWHAKFPGVGIWNVTKDSKLPVDMIPQLDADVFWEDRISGLLERGADK